ncbi:MAG: hypothetical protein QXV62_03850 [Nitrososphaerota archaeon]
MLGRRRGEVAEALLDILVGSLNTNRIPLKMGWKLVELYQQHRLESRDGLRLLRRACMISEPEKTRAVPSG